MTPAQAIAHVRKTGVILVSARSAMPSLVETIAGEAIKGSWWAHPKGRMIFPILEAATDSSDVLVCRLVGGKITLVHRRLWPALVRAAGSFSRAQLARVEQEHTPSGRHVNRVTAFPKWVPRDILAKAKTLSERAALTQLAPARALGELLSR